ncbi:MAG TPA: acyl-CoA thioesterase domain-containing protein [Pseudomonadales bacterium]
MNDRMPPPFTDLIALTSAGPDRFIAPPAPDKGDRVYGGQFLGQCLTAALRTVNSDRAVHSLHAYFLRPGNVDEPLDLTVERLRDGRSFSSREVIAEQQGRRLFQMLVSLQVPEPAPEYAGAALPPVPDPESVAVTYDDFTLAQTGADDWHGAARPMEIRYVNPPERPRGEPITEPQLMWMRIAEPLPDDPAVHAAALAYLSDSTLVDTIMLPLGLRWQDADFLGTSLDHAMWWHRPARADEWLLFEQRAEATGGGRGLASGRFFTRDGTLVATCLQEGLMRWDGGATAR